MTQPDARAHQHIRALADEMKNALNPDDPSPAALFMSGAVNGLVMAVQILDGGTAEQALETLETRLATAVGRAYLAGNLAAPVHTTPEADHA